MADIDKETRKRLSHLLSSIETWETIRNVSKADVGIESYVSNAYNELDKFLSSTTNKETEDGEETTTKDQSNRGQK